MRSEVKLWLEHPMTQLYRRLLTEHRKAHMERFLNIGVLDSGKLPELAQIKGQVNALDLMLDIDQLDHFLDGEINDERV